MSDRVIVMREGRIVAEYPREGLTAEKLVRAAAGMREQAIGEPA
jgi:rhamnose transport system ATP-binding protein